MYKISKIHIFLLNEAYFSVSFPYLEFNNCINIRNLAIEFFNSEIVNRLV